MPGVIAADVVVPLEVAAVSIIAIAKIPVARRRDTMQHAAIVKHRQIEAAAIPGDDLRRKFLDTVEEALNDLALAVIGFRQ